jgi:hypothetical protein
MLCVCRVSCRNSTYVSTSGGRGGGRCVAAPGDVMCHTYIVSIVYRRGRGQNTGSYVRIGRGPPAQTSTYTLPPRIKICVYIMQMAFSSWGGSVTQDSTATVSRIDSQSNLRTKRACRGWFFSFFAFSSPEKCKCWSFAFCQVAYAYCSIEIMIL